MAGETTPYSENLRDVVHGTVSLNGRIENDDHDKESSRSSTTNTGVSV